MTSRSVTPLTLPLADDRADPALVGGKGASLAIAARAGLPVPDGFHVTTSAYREFAEEAGIARRLDALIEGADPADPTSSATIERGVKELFEAHRPSPTLVAAIGEALTALSGPVAVRSSATAEDLPEHSFAGQLESFLHLTEPAAVVAAVRACWASLWTARAVEYRARTGLDGHPPDIAVVVQELVPAECSGVLFTADPVTGDRDRMVVNATWGLGESLVGGSVTPDEYTVSGDGRRVLARRIGDKAVETVTVEGGTVERPVPAERRGAPTLDDGRLRRLADLGRRVAREYGRPMDVEWAWHDDRPYLLQARPVTGLPTRQEVWNDTLHGDFLWSAGNLGEALPGVMTPVTWALVQRTIAGAMAIPEDGPYRLAGNIGGRLYVNHTFLLGAARALGVGRVMAQAADLAFGEIPADMSRPDLPVPWWRLLPRLAPGAARFQIVVGRLQRDLPGHVRRYRRRCEVAVAAVDAADTPAALISLWHEQCAPLHRDGPRLLAAGSRVNGMELARLRPWLRSLVDDADATTLSAGVSADGELASLGPLRGLYRLAAGEIDRDAFVAEWGHRCPDELELAAPRPAEDPAWIDRQLAGLSDAPDIDSLLARRRRDHAEAMERFGRAHPGRVTELRRRLRKASEAVRAREATRSESVRGLWPVRRWLLRTGELTGLGDDVFMLRPEELLAVLAGDDSRRELIPARRAAYDHYRALPAYPVLIRGRFDPEAWAADPDRRIDRFDPGTGRPAETDPRRIVGTAGSSGVAVGTARVVGDPTEADRLGHGEVLVTRITNIGWTPVFPRVAAVVTDIGASLSHAAIVARELGVPAVVGCGDATARIRTGDRVRVDGDTGTVEILTER